MSETEPSPERPVPTREEVVQAYRTLVERGYTHPNDLPTDDDPGVTLADEIFNEWRGAVESNPSHLYPPVQIEHDLSASTIHVDAGFSDRGYLNEVANQWLADDQMQAEGLGLTELAARIRAKRDEINVAIAEGTIRANRERLLSAAAEALGEEVVQRLTSLKLDNQDLEWAIYAELVRAGFDEPEKLMPELE